MEKNYRSGRLGEEIRKTVGMMLLTELKDHRLQGRMISVSDVEVSSDGSYATVYLSVMGRNIESGTGRRKKGNPDGDEECGRPHPQRDRKSRQSETCAGTDV